MLGAMDAAEDCIAVLHAVPDDAASAMRAHRRERLDGALEGVEGVRLAVLHDLERLVVSIPTSLAT